MGIELTESQLDEVLADPKVQLNISIGGVDTCTREAAGHFLAMKIVGRGWPLYGEGEDVGKAFFASYNERAPMLGYKVVT